MRNLFTAEAADQLYFIFVYIQLVLITPIVVKAAKSKMAIKIVCLLITPLAVIAVIYPMYSKNIVLQYPFSCLFVWNFIYYFFGMIIHECKSVTQKIHGKICIVICVITFILEYFETYYWIVNDSLLMAYTQLKITNIVFSLAVIMLIFSIIKKNETVGDRDYNHIIRKIFVLIGNDSFGIFLSHIFVNRWIEYVTDTKIVEICIFPINWIIAFLIDIGMISICKMVFPLKVDILLGVNSFEKRKHKSEQIIKKMVEIDSKTDNRTY